MRNLNNEEKEALLSQKLGEGKDIDSALEEIKRDKEFINELNKKNREIEKELNKIKKEKEKIKKQFKKKFEDLIKQKQKKADDLTKPLRTPSVGFASTLHLRRILRLLETAEKLNLREIEKATLIQRRYLKDALNFLEKHKLIIKSRGNKGVDVYEKRNN